MDDNKALNELQTGTERNKQIHLQNELIDLFGEINSEELLIEPEDVSEADSEFMTSAPGYFDHKEWFQKLNEEEQDEKVPKWGRVVGDFTRLGRAHLFHCTQYFTNINKLQFLEREPHQP